MSWLVAVRPACVDVHSPSSFLVDFWRDTKANSATRFITADILMFSLVAAILVTIEGRKHKVRFVWADIVGSFPTAVSASSPLFLIARELRMSQADPRATRTVFAV